MISTDEGISILINPVSVNACVSIRDNLDPDSKITEVSDTHRIKQPSPKISTDEGITISINPLLSNAHLSIRDNLDPDSKITDVSDLH
jgi:hypothetical protein